MIRALVAFPVKEWRLYRSYRFAMFLNLASILFGVATFFYVGRLFDQGGSPILAGYRGYFPFALVGIAASNFLISSLNGLATTLRHEQDIGTLETILASPIPDTVAIFGLVLWNVFLALITGSLYILAGSFLAPLSINPLSLLKTVFIVILAGSAFLGLGGIAAAFILYFKRGNPIAWIFSSLSVLLGGIYFPVDLLPEFLRSISLYLPLTCAVDAMRGILLQQASLTDLFPRLLILTVFSAICVPLSIGSLKYSLRRTRRAGALNHQ